eukprot:COSAG06_NODE_51659_length_310_cov_1.725118_1_plen_40_part_10
MAVVPRCSPVLCATAAGQQPLLSSLQIADITGMIIDGYSI